MCERKGVGLGVERDGQEGFICIIEMNEKKGMLFSWVYKGKEKQSFYGCVSTHLMHASA